MKILTVRQPYASCIIRGSKDVENRSRPTLYRGIIAILSATNIFADGRAGQAARRCFGDSSIIESSQDFPRGGIIGVAELYDVVTESPSWWFTGPFGYLLRNPHPIPFIACSGYQQAVVSCPPAIEAELLKHL
jgi:hypothetical protein